jgi:hypothetical protein
MQVFECISDSLTSISSRIVFDSAVCWHDVASAGSSPLDALSAELSRIDTRTVSSAPLLPEKPFC